MRLSGVLMLLSGAMLVTACGGGDGKSKWNKGNEPEAARLDPLVEVVAVVRGNISSFERSSGRIEARSMADVHAQISEICVELLHDVGDTVDRGTVLARLDNERTRIQMEAATLARDDARLTHQRNLLDAGKRLADLERIERYFNPEDPQASSVFTKDAYDAAKLEHNKAANTVEASEIALRKAEGELGAIALQLRHTEVRAPIRGVITERGIRLNELVSQNAVLFRMADLTALEVKLDVAEASISGLRDALRVPAVSLLGLEEKPDLESAQAVLLGVTAFPQERMLAYLDRVTPVVDNARGMVPVTVRIIPPHQVDETEHKGLLDKLDPISRKAVLDTRQRAAGGRAVRLLPGMFADAQIATRLVRDALLVPGAALSGDDEIIWKVEVDKDSPANGTVRRVEVQGRRGLTTDGKFELRASERARGEGRGAKGKEASAPRDSAPDIEAGDLIVVRGQGLLRDGQRVRVRNLGE